MLTDQDQERLLTLIERIARRRRENRDDASEIAAMGCQCGGAGDASGVPDVVHARSCPISIAVEVLADVVAAAPNFQPINPSTITAERGKPIRAECESCGRYARLWALIRHEEGCPNS